MGKFVTSEDFYYMELIWNAEMIANKLNPLDPKDRKIYFELRAKWQSTKKS